MLAATRKFAKSWAAVLLIGLLIVSFAIFGVNDALRTVGGNDVIKAGSRSLSAADFDREFKSYKGELEQQAGQQISVEVAAQNGLDRQVLQLLAMREAFAEVLSRAGVTPSDSLVAAEIAKIPGFFDQVSGRFDKNIYAQRLGERGLTPAKFDQVVRDTIAQQHVGMAFASGLQMPRAYTALSAIYAFEARDIAYFRVTPANITQPAPPTEAQLVAFAKENAAQLMRPELRVLTVVRFSPAAVVGQVKLDEAELRKRYEFRKDTLSTPETRTIVQVPAKSPAEGQKIAARLTAGEDPATVAKSVGVDAITYASKPGSAIADKKVAAAAFGMRQGQIAVVQGDLGTAVIQVQTITPGVSVSFEEARPQLASELMQDAASEKVYALTQTYEDAHQGGASLTEAAAKAGVPALTIGPVTRDGRTEKAPPPSNLTPKILETAFELPAGGESDLVEAGGGEYFAVKVERIVPAAVPPMAEIRPELIRVWMGREALKRIQAKADELAARIRKGESIQAVAASIGQQVLRGDGVTRQSAAQSDVPRDLLGKAFAGKKGDVVVGDDNRFGLVVGQVAAVRADIPPTVAMLAEQARPQVGQTLLRELNEAALRSSREKLKVKVNYNLARTAIGLEPVAATPPAKAEKAKK